MKKFLTICLSAILAVCALAFVGCTPETPENDGVKWSGEVDEVLTAVDNVIEISTPEQLAGFAKSVNVGNNGYAGYTIRLTENLDLCNKEWEPIGQTLKTTFKGLFDGNGKTIYNLYVDSTDIYTDINDVTDNSKYASGLFGFVDVDSRTVIKDLTIDGATVKANHWAGVIVGYATGIISGCTVKNASVSCTYANAERDGDKAGIIAGMCNTQADAVSLTGNRVVNCTVSACRDAGQIAGCAVESCLSENVVENVVVRWNDVGSGTNIRNEQIGRVL